MRREKVFFGVGADTRAGHLFIPEAAAGTDTRWPSVVLAHGFSGTMDRLLPHAERFAAGGIAALVFDYRGFGESGGEPRQVVDLPSQQDDLRAAIAWVRGRDDLDPDRVALWGNSLGGAHVISVAADDPGIAAVVAQIPFNGFPRVRDRSTTATLRLLAAILWDALRGRLGLSPAYIPMIGEPGQVAVVATTEAQRHLRTLAGEAGTTLWRNQVAPRGLLQMMRYRPALAAARLRAPLLVCVAVDDAETPEAMTRELADRAPRGTLRRYSGTHFDFYGDPSVRDRALADQLGFLHEHLRIPSGAA
ncbi:MAG TPA: alpha/beta fold hydrolase [Actinomycetota bacterium]|jgi:alpha-beta hydrolase superfamily lysophospholipase|nr:alpha/beta fold hydrolase [Actinomycetota bacterium]